MTEEQRQEVIKKYLDMYIGEDVVVILEKILNVFTDQQLLALVLGSKAE